MMGTFPSVMWILKMLKVVFAYITIELVMQITCMVTYRHVYIHNVYTASRACVDRAVILSADEYSLNSSESLEPNSIRMA